MRELGVGLGVGCQIGSGTAFANPQTRKSPGFSRASWERDTRIELVTFSLGI